MSAPKISLISVFCRTTGRVSQQSESKEPHLEPDLHRGTEAIFITSSYIHNSYSFFVQKALEIWPLMTYGATLIVSTTASSAVSLLGKPKTNSQMAAHRTQPVTLQNTYGSWLMWSPWLLEISLHGSKEFPEEQGDKTLVRGTASRSQSRVCTLQTGPGRPRKDWSFKVFQYRGASFRLTLSTGSSPIEELGIPEGACFMSQSPCRCPAHASPIQSQTSTDPENITVSFLLNL